MIVRIDNVSTKKTNTITTNVTGAASINCHSKKVRDYYILHTVLFSNHITMIIIFAIIMQNKKVQYKMENNELKIVRVSISMI